MEKLNEDWLEYADVENMGHFAKGALEDMLNSHIDILKAEILEASKNGNTHIYDTTRAYVAGIYKAIALIKQSKPDGK